MLTAAVVVTVFPLHTYFAVNVIVPAVVTFDAVVPLLAAVTPVTFAVIVVFESLVTSTLLFPLL